MKVHMLSVFSFRASVACVAVLVLLSVGFARPAMAGFVVDGNLGDWGIAISGGHNDYNAGFTGAGSTATNPINFEVIPPSATGAPTSPQYWEYAPSGPNVFNGWKGSYERGDVTVYFHLEDTHDGRNDYWVGPVWGGQNYDAEFLGVAKDGNNLLIGLSSGQRSDNGWVDFQPGDIRIKTVDAGGEFHYYGLEVGGAAAFTDMAGTLKWEDGSGGATFNLDSSGHLASDGSRSVVAGQLAGAVLKTGDWNSADWKKGIIGYDGSNVAVQLVGGVATTTAELVYNQATALGQHAWLEASINLNHLIGQVVEVFWAPSCGNDIVNVLDVRIPQTPPPPVPEPSSLLCWFGLALGGVVARRWRKRRS